MNIRPFLLPAAIFLATAHAAEQKPNNCDLNETAVFSCRIQKKVASLCATSALTTTSGRLTYRFGAVGANPEMVFSNTPKGPASSYSAEFESWAKGHYSAVTFKRGSYSYTVYNRMAAFEEDDRSNGGGVRVFREGKQIADMWCTNDSINDRISETLEVLGLPGKNAP